MDRLSSHRATKEVVNKHNFKFSKSLGQNFLIDDNVIDRILEGARLSETDRIIEVGPGIGTLTREMGKVAENVVSIEIDKTLIPILKETLADLDNVEVVNEDILKVDVQGLIKEKLTGGPVKLVANLPYYITTPIVMKFLEEDIPVTDIVVMVQKEVAQRLAAKPGEKLAGAITYSVQYYCETKLIVEVSNQSFIPAPEVDSEVINLKIRNTSPVKIEDEKIFFKLIKASFMQRRKTFLNGVSNSGLIEKEKLKEILNKMNISENVRGENLTLEQFAQISNKIGNM